MKKSTILSAFLGGLMMASCATDPQNGNCEATCQTDTASIVLETIMARRSVRKYKDTPVEREKLETLAKCGINAPSGMNAQPWVVRIVDNPEYINGVTEIYKKANAEQVAGDPNFVNMFRNAPAIIAVGVSNQGGDLDCGMLGENIMIAAQAMGLGTCCLGGPVRFMTSNEEARPYLEKLQIPEDYHLLYILAVGYPDEKPEAKPREESKIMFID